MKKLVTYFTLLIALAVFAGCNSSVDKRVTLWRNDRIAYGTFYAFANLHYLFPSADIDISHVSPAFFDPQGDSLAAYIVIGSEVLPDEKELNAILGYAAAGNHVFISAAEIGKNLLDSLRLAAPQTDGVYTQADSLAVDIVHPASDRRSAFFYPGRAISNEFNKVDSTITQVIGTNMHGRANFVKFTYENGGSICVQLAPATFTNFFLLHKNNKRYYDLALSQIPGSVRKVRWDDYYRHHRYGKDESQPSGASKLGAFLANPVLRWAFWLAIVLFGLIYLFESKRKQRPVPIIAPLRNSSLDFVQTIGRLYHQRHDNKNLASKMAAHFLGHLRMRYSFSMGFTDPAFATKLAFRTGYPIEKVEELSAFISRLDEAGDISDDELLHFSRKLDEFYKQT